MLPFNLVLACLAVLPDAGAALDVAASGPGGFSALIGVPAPVAETVGDGLCYPSIPGFGLSCLEGDFMRPSLAFYVPLPPGVTDPVVTWSVIERSAFRIPDGSAPAPVPVLLGSGLETTESWPATAVGPVPSECFSVEIVRLAGVDLARVVFTPFTGRSFDSYVSRASIGLEWDAAPGSRGLDDGLLSLICPRGVVWWPPRGGERPADTWWGLPWARLVFEQTGCYAIDCSDLEAAGCGIAGTPSSSLRLFTGPGTQFEQFDPADEHGMVEAAVLVEDGGDGTFDPGDSLFFVGLALDRFEPNDVGVTRLFHRYSRSNSCFLTWGAGPGVRMRVEPVSPDGSPPWGPSLTSRMWLEQEYLWLVSRETRTGWVWDVLISSYPAYFGFVAAGATGDGSLDVGLVGNDFYEHRQAFYLNGTLFSDTTWNGAGEEVLEYGDLPLVDGTNSLMIETLEPVGSPDDAYLNFLGISYPRSLSDAAGRELMFAEGRTGRFTLELGGAQAGSRIFDYTDPTRVSLLDGAALQGGTMTLSTDIEEGTRILLADPSSLRAPDSIIPTTLGRIRGTLEGGDVAIVAAEPLMDGARILEAACAARGLEAHAVSLREVYDEFGQGVPDPGAIRSFFRWTQDAWSPAATHLILVGDGHYDPLGHATSQTSLMPVLLTLGVDEGSVSDDYFAVAHAGGEYPEVPVSRIPAETASEMSSFLAKLLLYDSGDADGDWLNRSLFIADDEWGQYSQDETEHTITCEFLADSVVSSSSDRGKFYLITFPWPGTGREKPEARAAVIEELGRGFGSVIFVGHGSYGQICHEKLLVSSDISLVENDGRLPVMAMASCDVGRFDLLSSDCMAEEFVLEPRSGAMACIAATRATGGSQNRSLFVEYYDLLLGSGSAGAGDALWAAKLLVPDVFVNSRRYAFFGDCSQPFRRPPTTGASLSLDSSTIVRGSPNHVTASFPGPATAMVRVAESAAWTVYNCIGGANQITWLRYGADAFRGIFPAPSGELEFTFFCPVQADTGAFGRASAPALTQAGTVEAWQEWVPVVDSGGYPADSTGPSIDMWMVGHAGEENPVTGDDPVMHARLSDPSGIAAFGGSAGRALLVSLDSQGFDISADFAYLPGSTTTGEVGFDPPDLFQGPHTLILAAWDGMGNSSRDTLSFEVSGQNGPLVTELVVYPNPAEGPRCFSFRASEAGTASVGIFTVAGRQVWSTSRSFQEGYCQVLWDGLDSDGDPPASGPYIFVLEFDSPGGRSQTSNGILAVVRGG